MDLKDVSIIIPHLGANEDQCRSLRLCLASLGQDVIVVKNGLVDCDCPYSIKLTGQGQCMAVNAAAATVNTDWLFISNDDMMYAPGWFGKLVAPIADDSIKVISPNLVEPHAGAPTFIEYFCGGAGGDFDMVKWFEFAATYQNKRVEAGFNFPVLIKKELWDLIGGYDVHYDPWGSNSDSDLQAKIHLAGLQTLRNFNSIVYHFSQTSGTFEPRNQGYWSKNWDYFIKKWGFERQGDAHKVWKSQDLIDYKKLKFHPFWEGFYD